MKRTVRSPFRWLFGRHAARLSAASRASAYLTCALLAAAAISARAAWAAVGEGSLAAGRQMEALRDVLGSTKTLAFNGQRMHVSTAVTHLGVGAVLDRFQAECGQNPSGLTRVVREVATAEAAAVSAVLDAGRTPFGVLRRDDDKDGIVICLADRRYGAVPARDLLEAFVKTRDASLFGDMMYVFAERVDGERTHVITTWTSGPFYPLDLFPAVGDAPGDDSALVARPADSRRILSGVSADAPYGVRVYESAESPERLFARFDADMAARGWERAEGDAVRPGGRLFLHPSGVMAEAFASSQGGKTVVTTLEMGRSAPAEPTEPTGAEARP